jgi:hypothetical protein
MSIRTSIELLFICSLALAVPSGLRAEEPAAENTGGAQPSAGTATTDEPLAPDAAQVAAEQGRAFIAHIPRGSADADSIRLGFDVRGADLAGEIRVYFRALEGDMSKVQHVVVTRDEHGYHATIPSSAVRAPGVAYWVVERMPDSQERKVFASAREPAPLHVYYGSVDSREQRLLSEHDGHRSRALLRGEYVDLGDFDVASPVNAADGERDRYYHLEAQYSYRFFRTIDELEFALGSLRGDVLDQDDLTRRRKIGLDYGRSAITFAFGEWFRLRTGLLLGVSTKGFEGGFDAATIFGNRAGTEFELRGGYVSGLGGQFGTRVGWATVPRVPMGARVEITNFPTKDDLGVRLLFDIGYQLTDEALVRFIGGYRGRTSLAGGPSLALEVGYAF